MVEVKLKVLAGSNVGKEIPVPMARFMIGRSDECQLRPKSDAISRNHCTILVSDDEVTVRDLNSRNGTYVNDEKTSGDQSLKNGDILRVGKLQFEVVVKVEAQVAAVPAPDTADKGVDGDSSEFDIAEWLDATNTPNQQKRSDPDTRQFKLDETDRIALEKAAAAGASESTGDSAVKKQPPTQKKEPGKLPDRNKQAASTSREAAADMLKKFFNNR